MLRKSHVEKPASAYLYTWDPGSQKWCINDVMQSEEAAREKGRLLWKGGAAGIRIDVIRTVVESLRFG